MIGSRISTKVAIIMLGFLLPGCATLQPAATPTQAAAEVVTLTVSGSGDTSSVLTAIQEKFESQTPGYKLNVLAGTGTGGGVEGVLKDVLDVAAMARPPKSKETSQGIKYVEFGKAGIAILVNSSAGITNLTTDQVNRLFFGEKTNWSAVGGANLPVIVYVRDPEESATVVLREVMFGETPFPELAQVLTSTGDMITLVDNTPGATGFASWPAVVTTGPKNLPLVSLNGVAPTESAYTVTIPLGIGYSSDRKADIQPLIDWLLSDEGQAALKSVGVIINP